MDNKNIFKAQINGNLELELDQTQLDQLDIVPNPQGGFHIIHNNTTYQAQVVATDFDKKTFTISINGNEYAIQLSDAYDALIQKMGLNVSSGNKMNEVKAPMPGLVLDVLVEAGQTVQKGDPLLVLEAMKMENVLKASGEGTIKAIVSAKGSAVNKGDILIELS